MVAGDCQVVPNGLELDAVLDTFALELFEVGEYTELIDRFDRVGAQLQADSFACFWNEEALGLQVGQKPTARLSVGVRNIIAGRWPLPSKFANLGHDNRL